ncbi:alpha-amylase/4-alpha-glucanotransferase domain-containing protein [Endomicrobium proavitum]|uniref:Glycoside hydrolase family 57, Alpha-amylase/alpha-mannosidase n=1 Tax=Endomicrobium proavitum TaxID=1408281 RepID=A0A0G3WHX4_9BACT|nr:alpha-amylase/4-alpha-glucanotransferase domain-containing protein [Endomicrobium proavitum]AKL97470.1 Glycoside hydrolase family 57, Alpha-amylase/alpha-mannosidase [Endomicrobium proavitum]
MSKVKFIFCVHNHQPVGNFEWVFEKAYQVSYKPFMDVMLNHPKIKWCMHASGMIWEFCQKEHPEYIKNVKKLVASGNLEILSGGYYEPIISSVPDRDKNGQIQKLTQYVKDVFGCREAHGAWLAERVWEPSLAKPLCESGIKYTVLDDAHFAASGINTDDLKGYYVTEEQGCSLNVFPISQRLRYTIPFHDVNETIEYFKDLSRQNADKNSVVVMADDGEKFGMWPGTNKHVYENGWLERFLTALEENFDTVETATFSEVLKTEKPSGRVYLPCASYFEMSEWSLPAPAQEKFDNVLAKYGSDRDAKTFLHGGFWRNFLTKYEEANNMHKKMLRVSDKVGKYVLSKKPLAQKALDNLYAGQCNCAYWHGVFGGLYLPHLRKAVYASLLKAENLYNKSFLKRAGWLADDFSRAGKEDFLYESKHQNIYVNPQDGGSIFEWDIFKINHNFSDVLTRRYESYHKKLKDNINNAVVATDNEYEVQTIHNDAVKVKEFGLDKFLVYDNYRRTSLRDHFVGTDIKYEDFAFSRYCEMGDFTAGEYKVISRAANLELERNGKAYGKDISVKKNISAQHDGYEAAYEITNNSSESIEICFICEQVFAFSSKDGDDTANDKNVSGWKRYDDYYKAEVELKFSQDCDLFVYPLETVSASDSGYERTYQGTVAAPVARFHSTPGGTVKFSIKTSVNFKTII